jgi:hypothetical protein
MLCGVRTWRDGNTSTSAAHKSAPANAELVATRPRRAATFILFIINLSRRVKVIPSRNIYKKFANVAKKIHFYDFFCIFVKFLPRNALLRR